MEEVMSSLKSFVTFSGLLLSIHGLNIFISSHSHQRDWAELSQSPHSIYPSVSTMPKLITGLMRQARDVLPYNFRPATNTLLYTVYSIIPVLYGSSAFILCPCSTVRSPSVWTWLMHWVACSHPTYVIGGRHTGPLAARWLSWQPLNIPKTNSRNGNKEELYITLSFWFLCQLNIQCWSLSYIQKIPVYVTEFIHHSSELWQVI